MSWPGRFAVALLLVAASSVSALGAERWHTVVYGDSVSAIARQYYGDYALSDLLLRFNERSDPGIRPGDRLRVPYCSVHVVKPGDTGSKLAQRYLGRPSAWAAIAELNGLSPADPLRVEESLLMPVVLRHALAQGESLAALADRYYDDPLRGRLLQSFNRIEDPRELAVGRLVEVPLITLRLAERPAVPKPPSASEPAAAAPPTPAPDPVTVAGNAPESTALEASRAEAIASEPITPEATADRAEPAPTEKPVPTPAWFDQGFAEAERAYNAGDFELARTRLAALTGRVESIPALSDRARLWRLSAFVHVAFDRDDEACTAFRSLRTIESPVELDPNLVSPKIREALAACKIDEAS